MKTKTAPVRIDLNAATAAAKSFAKAQTTIDRNKAKMDSAIAKAKADYQTTLDEQTGLIEEASEVLEAYAGEHWHEWEKGSIALAGVCVGYRKGTPAVQVPKEKEAAVIEKLKTSGLKRFLRVTYALDKKGILSETKPSIVNQLKEAGITTGKADIFFAELEK